MPPPTILIVEDDPSIASTLRDILASEHYAVRHAATAAQARASLDNPPPDLILLDLVLPDADGLVLCADLKSKLNVPIIVCSGTIRTRDSILSLKLGADDFIAKPFDVDELLSRVEAVLRRARTETVPPTSTRASPARPIGFESGASRVGELTLEHVRRRVTFAGQDVPLTPTEYRLLAAFMARPDEVLSRRDLAQVVWGYEDASVGRSIDVHVHRLRTKLLDAQTRQRKPGPNVIAVRGFGYKLIEDVSAVAAIAA